jgi:hypothetical protein
MPENRHMNVCRYTFAVTAILATIFVCSVIKGQQSGKRIGADVQSSGSKEKKIDSPNEFGFSKISIRDEDLYQEGIVDADGKEIIQPRSNMLINDITGKLALVQLERKFLFVPLDDGPIAPEDMDRVKGFQYANPYQCGFALVVVDDVWFYLDRNFEKAFDRSFEFAESFHHDRAWVKEDGRNRIIDTEGKTVAELNYDQVSPQSPWCWQVVRIEGKKYRSGFVDLDGNLITEIVYDDVGFYDPEVKRIRVTRNNLHGFLDEHAKVVIPVKYERAQVFNHGKARVELDGRAFYINPDGIEVPE